MDQRQGAPPVRGGHRLGEEQGILVVQVPQIAAVVRGELHRPLAPPVHEVVGEGEGDARAGFPVRGVGHHVGPQRRKIRHARILHAAPIPAVALIGLLGLQDHAQPLHVLWVALAVVDDAGQADARVVAGADQARQQVERPVGAARDGRVEHAARLARVGQIGGHDDPQALDVPGLRVQRVHPVSSLMWFSSNPVHLIGHLAALASASLGRGP